MEIGNRLQLVLLFRLCSVIFASSNSSTESKIDNGSIISNQSFQNYDVFNCSFLTEDSIGKEKICRFIDEKKEIIFIHFHILNESNMFPSKSGRKIYKMFNLVRTSGGFGNELLHMHPQFEELSLGILMFGVEHVDIQFLPMASECFVNSTEDKVHNDLMTFATNEFDLLEHVENQKTVNRICSMFVENINGMAEFNYKCCSKNVKFSFECRIIEKNFWIRNLFFTMTCLYIIAFLYSPLLIPTSWYKNNENTLSFRLTKPISVSFIKASKEKDKTILNYNNIKDMEKLKPLVDKLKVSSPVDVNVSKVEIKLVDELKTVSSTFVPAGILHYLYRTFIKCHVKNNENVKECCDAKCCVGPCCKCKWHKCLKPSMQIVFLICLLFPWFVRVLFFYFYEEEDRNDRTTFANELNLDYPNIFQWNLTYSLKPDHPFFILCYVFTFFIIFTKGLVKLVFQGAEIDKIDKNVNKRITKVFRTILRPCQRYGIIGFIFWPIYITLISPYIIFRYILPSVPLINIFLTVLCGLLEDTPEDAKKKWRKNKITAVFWFLCYFLFSILLLCVLVTPLLLCLEVIVFSLQIMMYVTIGIILNASRVLTYVTFAGILLFYAYNSIRHVRKKYELFSRTVMEFFILNLADSIKDLINGGVIQNCALQFLNRKDDSQLDTLLVKDDKLTLSSNLPFLFFDNNGKPSLHENVFFKMCNMNSIGAPGLLWKSYKKAFLNFLIIVLFLFLVATIILAFGQSQGIPDTYQALATLGGGLIPLLLQKYLFKSHNLSDFRTEHFMFREELNTVFENYHIHFEIADIESNPSDQHHTEKCQKILIDPSEIVETKTETEKSEAEKIETENNETEKNENSHL